MVRISSVIVFVILLFGCIGNSALASEFSADDDKALVIFAMMPIGHDVLVNAAAVDAKKGGLNIKKGFNVILGQGTPLFGPHTREYETDRSNNIMLQKKKLKPGSYMFISGNGEAENGKTSLMCFASGSKLFSVEAGQVYLIALPDGQAIKVGDKTDWALDPKLSDEELLSAYQDYRQRNSGIDAPVSVVTYQNASFEPRMKFGSCHPPKSGAYQIISPLPEN
jgi:hypothetical protein